jgi:hypothetical protein
MAMNAADDAKAIRRHVERHLGPIMGSIAKAREPDPPVVVLVTGPTEKRPFASLVTSGMSARPVLGVADADSASPPSHRVELLLGLPSGWPLAQLKEAEYGWPVALIRALARLPHDHGSRLGPSTIVPNGDPPQSYVGSSRFCAALAVSAPPKAPPLFQRLALSDSRIVNFYALLMLHADEAALGKAQGVGELLRRLAAAGVTESFDPDRVSVVGEVS